MYFLLHEKSLGILGLLRKHSQSYIIVVSLPIFLVKKGWGTTCLKLNGWHLLVVLIEFSLASVPPVWVYLLLIMFVLLSGFTAKFHFMLRRYFPSN